MNKLADYFKTSGMRLGVFYPTHHLIAVFRNPAGSESALNKLLNAGFAPSDAIAADGKAVLEFDEEKMHLAGFVMQGPLDARYYSAIGIEHLAGDFKTD
jgi:hypothetical protein